MEFNRTLSTLEFDKMIEELTSRANTAQAREQIRKLTPYLEENELLRNLRETDQAREMLDKIGLPPIPVMEHVEEYLEKAVKGDLVTPQELESIGSFLTAIKRMDDYLERGKVHQLSIAYYNQDLTCMEDLRENIARCIRNGQVDDYATSVLKDIRRDLQLLETKIQDKAENLVRTQKSFMADSFIVKRSGHICVPVKKEYKSRIPGSVIDKSSTGATLFIEPQAIAKLTEEYDLLMIEEDCEVRKILYTLAGEIADSEETFRSNLKIIIKLDFMFAKGKLSADLQAVSPAVNTEGYIYLKQARHPMLDKESCVPLNIELGCLDKDTRRQGMVITGPNTGGKTVTMKTVGLLSLMAGCGLHVPCEEANISMQNQVLCDIGDGQNISDNLSTFSSHIQNVINILQKATRESLVLLDELGSGTDPAEGMGIAIAILEKLRQNGCLFLVTTHYPEVKTYALGHPEIQNARMAFDRENLRPLYRLEMGKTGDSCALYIARRLGLPDDMIRLAAKEAYGEVNEEMMKELRGGTGEEITLKKLPAPHIRKKQEKTVLQIPVSPFERGDSVAVMPEGKIGIVVKPADRNGNVYVQIQKERVLISHKRLKLKVSAKELYPEDYDFSIIFDTVENRKARHQMDKKHQEGLTIEWME